MLEEILTVTFEMPNSGQAQEEEKTETMEKCDDERLKRNNNVQKGIQ